MTDDTCPALPMAQTCEHFYASHCYRGMSVRLCMLCHEPDWDDLAGQAESSAAEPADRSADATGPAESNWRERAEQAEAKLAAQREYDTYRRALWVMVRHFRGSVFLTSGQMEDVPLLASLGIGREPGGIRINAGDEP